AANRIDEALAVLLNPVVAQHELFGCDERDTSEADGKTATKRFAAEIKLEAVADAVLLDIEIADHDRPEPLFEIAQRRDAVKPHVEDVVFENPDVQQIAIRDRRQRMIRVTRVLGIWVGMNAAVVINHPSEVRKNSGSATTAGRVYHRYRGDEGHAAERDAVVVSAEDVIAPHLDAL